MPQEKYPATPGIDPRTFQLVAQCLNHYTTPGRPTQDEVLIFSIFTKLEARKLRGMWKNLK